MYEGWLESGTTIIIVGVSASVLQGLTNSTYTATSTVCLFSEFVIKVGMLISLHGCCAHARLRLLDVQRYTVAVYKTHYPLAEKQV